MALNLKNLLAAREQIEFAKGVEETLLKRKRTGQIGLLIGIAGAVLQVIAALNESDLFQKLVAFAKDPQLSLQSLDFYQVGGLALLFAGLFIWWLMRYTRVLMQETKEPFRYTFWVQPFERIGERVKNNLDDGDDTFHPKDERLNDLLHHDLMQRLSKRIRRLSLLEIPPGSDGAALRAHIHVEGHYTVRIDKEGRPILQVMPRVKIGSADNPMHLTHPINITLEEAGTAQLTTPEYEQIVERVYSRLATEIYTRIQADLEDKIKMFPTSYLRAAALAVEAEDFARSNTIDAYSHAIELYQEAMRYFNVANATWIYGLMLRVPFVTSGIRFHHKLAEIKVGYAKSVIYQWYISSLSGRKRNSLFSLPEQLDEVIKMLMRVHNKMNRRKWRLEVRQDRKEDGATREQLTIRNRLHTTMAYFTFPEDNWLRSKLFRTRNSTFKRQRKIFFESYVSAALANNILGCIEEAREFLENAKALSPAESERNALYLMASGTLENNPASRIIKYRRATETAPDFEIAQFLLASELDMHFRNQNDLDPERAKVALNAYEETLKTNHGNVAAIAGKGYIQWLLGNNRKALEIFEQGLELKAIIRQINAEELYYGLARIYAEGGFEKRSADNGKTAAPSEKEHLDASVVKSYEYYHLAISVDPGVSIFYNGNSNSATTDYYNYISPAIYERYRKFRDSAKTHLKISAGKRKKAFSERAHEMKYPVYSFVLNDFGNAALNFYYRFGEWNKIEEAAEAFRQAITLNPQNKTAYFGLANTSISFQDTDEELSAFNKTVELNRNWDEAIVSVARSKFKKASVKVQDMINMADAVKTKLRMRQNAMSPVLHNPDAALGSFRVNGKEGSFRGPLTVMGDFSDKSEDNELKEQGQKALVQINDCISEVIGDLLKTLKVLIHESNLSSIFEGFSFDGQGSGIEELLKEPILRERLSEDDVNVLVIYAEVLSYNIISTGFHRAVQLFEYLHNYYYPLDFNRSDILVKNLNLKKEYDGLNNFFNSNVQRETPVKLQSYDALIAEKTRFLKKTISSWLDNDPIHYGSVTWAELYYDFDAYGKSLEKALEEIASFNIANPEGLNILKSDYNNQLAEMELTNGKATEAYPLLEESVKLDPWNLDALSNLIIATKRIPSKKLNLTRIARQWRSPNGTTNKNVTENLLTVAKKLQAKGESDQAYWCLEHLLEVHGQDLQPEDRVEILLQKAEAMNEDADHEDLVKLLKEAYQMAEGISDKLVDRTEILNQTGITYFRHRDFEGAIKYFEQAIEQRPDEPQYDANIADSYLELYLSKNIMPDEPVHGGTLQANSFQYYDSAIDKAKKIDSRQVAENGKGRHEKEANFVNLKGVAYYRLEDFKKAAELFAEAASKHLSVGLYYRNLGDTYVALDEPGHAEDAYIQGIKNENANSALHNMLGVLYYKQGNYDRAAKCFENAIERNNGVAQYYANLADSYAQLKKPEKAEKYYVLAAELSSPGSQPYLHYNNAGVTWYRQRNFAKGLPLFAKANQLEPQDPVVRLNMADCYLYLRQFEEARAAFIDILMVQPVWPYAQSGYADSLYFLGDYQNALQHYLESYHQEPSNQYALLRTWRCALKLVPQERQNNLPKAVARLQEIQRTSIPGKEQTAKQLQTTLQQLRGLMSASMLYLLNSRIALQFFLWSDQLTRGKNVRLNPAKQADGLKAL